MLERLDALLGEGRRDAVVATVFRELAGMTDAELAALRRQPSSQARVAAAHTVARELRGVAEAPLDLRQARRIRVPTLLLTGSESDDRARVDVDAVAAALPDARVVVLEGHGHVADVLTPEAFAGHVLGFLREGDA